MQKSISVDLNADLGEGYPFDEKLFPLISSANIACGGHAGDEQSIRASLKQCKCLGVSAGAHPSYPDKDNFGRKSLQLGPKELQDALRCQLDLFNESALKENIKTHHVKLHGALYNDCFDHEKLTELVLDVLKEYAVEFIYGPSNSKFNQLAISAGFQVIHEVFADRAYLSSGKLAPRSAEGAVLKDVIQVSEQLKSILLHHEVESMDGGVIQLNADTICLHGDNEHAIDFAKTIRGLLHDWGIDINAPYQSNKH